MALGASLVQLQLVQCYVNKCLMHFECSSNGEQITRKKGRNPLKRRKKNNSRKTAGEQQKGYFQKLGRARQEGQLILIVPFERSVGTRRMAKMAGILLQWAPLRTARCNCYVHRRPIPPPCFLSSGCLRFKYFVACRLGSTFTFAFEYVQVPCLQMLLLLLLLSVLHIFIYFIYIYVCVYFFQFVRMCIFN